RRTTGDKEGPGETDDSLAPADSPPGCIACGENCHPCVQLQVHDLVRLQQAILAWIVAVLRKDDEGVERIVSVGVCVSGQVEDACLRCLPFEPGFRRLLTRDHADGRRIERRYRAGFP